MFSVIFNKVKSTQNNFFDTVVSKLRTAVNYCVLYGFLYNLLMLSMSIYSLQVLDRVLSSGSTDTLLMLTIIVGASVMMMVCLNYARTKVQQGAVKWLDLQLNKHIFERSIHLSILSKGSSSSQFFRELENVKAFISGLSLNNIIDAPWAIIFIIILFIIHPVAGMLAIVGAVILITLALYSERLTKKFFEAANERFIINMQQMDVINRNAESVVAMGMMPNLYRHWNFSHLKGSELKSYAQNKSAYYSNITKFMRFAIQIATTGLGGLLVLKGEMTSGGMIASSILVGRALAPFEAIVASWNSVILSRKSYAKLQKFLENFPDNRGQIKLPKPTGNIEVSQLFFKHQNNQANILTDINFNIKAGETIGIIGNSAAGKSTLAKILVGVWPATAGKVNLDGTDIFRWQHFDDSQSLGEYIGYLPQDIELFNGTVKQNISRMAIEINEQEVIRVAHLAEVHEMIMAMPQGYETLLGIGGISLSGGQKQRIALARAFYSSPALIVLDEPNANLDKAGEDALFRAIAGAKKDNSTIVIISHRPSILGVVDKIMVINSGRLMSFASRDEIMKANKAGV
jgi:PrtD family type I secretion system ABC transporter